MKRIFMALSLAIVSFCSLTAKEDADPVLMTVNKKPVKLSEFEYLYNKNNAQQMATQPIDEYLDLFVVYKLKVAAAEEAGIGESDAFKNEYAGYCRDLSEPYLKDKAATDSLERLIYNRMDEIIDVSHIMVSKTANHHSNKVHSAMLDSLRTEIVSGRADFTAVAERYSMDPSVTRNHGHLGFMSSGMLPYTFEDAAYQTPVGEISEVIETPFGYHIVKVNDRRKAPGQVKVQHILKLTVDMDSAQATLQKAAIDSIYNLLAAGADFSKMAIAESEDPGSAKAGGVIDFFGPGRMVPEFEEVSFALKNGEMSRPFKTDYGYHIVRRLDWKGNEPFETLQPKIADFISRDERQYILVRSKMKQLKAKHGTTINSLLLADIQKSISDAGNLDSAMVAALAMDDREIISLNNGAEGATVASLVSLLPPSFTPIPAEEANIMLQQQAEDLADEASVEAERAALADENPEYRNLLNEYRDGMLLFEICDRNVWTKSKNDKAGLEKFFNENRAKYTDWTKPRFKGYVVFATNDSIEKVLKSFLSANQVADENLVVTLRKLAGKDVRVERVLAAKGDNEIIDFLMFGGEKPKSSKWDAYFTYKGEIIDQPQEAADVRGAVTADYQNELEQKWIAQLRKQYPVKINKKVFKAFKANISQN